MARDIILPDSIYNLFLKPIARRLKVKHISEKSSTLALAIFRAIAKRSKDFSIKLTGHKDTLDDFLATLTAIFRMGGSLLEPLFAVIPPQYVLIILAILLVPTAIIPMQVIGAFLLYQAEQNIKYPFKNMSKQKIDATQNYIKKHKFIIEKVIHREVTVSLKEFWLFTDAMKTAYLYDKTVEKYPALESFHYFLVVAGYFPEEAVNTWARSDREFMDVMNEIAGEAYVSNLSSARQINFNAYIGKIYWDQTFVVDAYFYDGYIRFLPPIMTTITKILSNVIKMFSGAFNQFNEMYDNAPEWLKPFFGIFQIIFTVV